MTKVSEAADPVRIETLRREGLPEECRIDTEARYVVEFRIDGVRPLVGNGQKT